MVLRYVLCLHPAALAVGAGRLPMGNPLQSRLRPALPMLPMQLMLPLVVGILAWCLVLAVFNVGVVGAVVSLEMVL